jgi:hypothetical protein
MVNLMIQIWYHKCCYILSKVHRRSLNLLWCVIRVPKLAKCANRSSNLLIFSYESQIYLNNLLNLFRSHRSTQAAADLTEAKTVVTGTEPAAVPRRGGAEPFPTLARHEGVGLSLRQHEGPSSNGYGGHATVAPGSTASEHGSRGLSRFNRLFK